MVITSNWNWETLNIKKYAPIINSISLILIVLSICVIPILEQNSSADIEWQDVASWCCGAAGIGFGGAAAIVCYFSGPPGWVLGLTISGTVCAAGALGFSMWGANDDDCYDCDGSGCDTCNPPDDDNCPNCDGSGCSTCQPPPPPPPTPESPIDRQWRYYHRLNSQDGSDQNPGIFANNQDQETSPGDMHEVQLITEEPYYYIDWYVKAPWETSERGTYIEGVSGDGTTTTASLSYTFPSGAMHTGDFLITAVIYRWSDMSEYEESYTVTVTVSDSE